MFLRASFFAIVCIGLIGCAGMAMSAAKRGDREGVERNLKYAEVTTDEAMEIWSVYHNKICSDAALASTPIEMTLLGNCLISCATPQFCNKEIGLKHIYRAAQYGYGPAQTYLTNLGLPLPKIDSQQVAIWQESQARKQREIESLQMQAAIESLKQQTCITEFNNGKMIQTCN